MSDPSCRIAPMDWVHLSQILIIEEKSFPNPWSREGFSYELNRDFSYPEVALGPSDEVRGYCVRWQIDCRAQIQNIAVAPEHRREGIASQLLRSAVSGAKRAGAHAVHLEVRASNLAAQRLYEEEGFELETRRRDHYTQPREDALLLRLKLTPSVVHD